MGNGTSLASSAAAIAARVGGNVCLTGPDAVHVAESVPADRDNATASRRVAAPGELPSEQDSIDHINPIQVRNIA